MSPADSFATRHTSLSRPSSRLSSTTPSSRPSSSASHCPPSGTSTTRPRQSAGRPPSSALASRPQSRFSQRTQARHAKSRLIPLAQSLVTLLTGLKDDEGSLEETGAYKKNVEHVVKSLESTTLNKGAASVDMATVEQTINGHALKARIMMKDVLSDSLLNAFKRLKDHIEAREKDLDHDIQTTHIPDHLQLLLSLSQPPSDATIGYAEMYLDQIKNPPPPPATLTWKDILAEEPFEGDHWEGIFDGDDQDWESTPSLSPLSSADLALDDDRSISPLNDDGHRRAKENEAFSVPESKSMPGSTIPPYTFAHRKEFEELQSMQYWRKDWKGDPPPSRTFNISDPSTLGPALTDVLAQERGGLAATQALLQHERYIKEEEMVREVYMALQGRKNIVLDWKDDAWTIMTDAPRLAHLTLASQASILSSFAQLATTLEHLRHFRRSVFALSNTLTHATTASYTMANLSKNITRTVEAFADAIDAELRDFDTWCASKEESICRIYTTQISSSNSTPVILHVSLLHTHKALQDMFEHTFDVLLAVMHEVFADDLSASCEFCMSYITRGRRAPAMVAARLLNTLFARVLLGMERGEEVTSGRIMRVFMRSAEPIWAMCGKWLKDGMGLGEGNSSNVGKLDDEFFIESRVFGINGSNTGLLHPDFWMEAYGLRGDADPDDERDGDGGTSHGGFKAVPMFLEHVAKMILRTGKAVGLLRVLGSTSKLFVYDSWKTFEELLLSHTSQGDSSKMRPEQLFSVSVDTLSRLIHDQLYPQCQAIGTLLTNTLANDCGLWTHLTAIEDLFLMRRRDTMGYFMDLVFDKMDSKQSWGDFHFLNAAFSDVVEASFNTSVRNWIQPSLVRISYRGGKEKECSIHRTVKALDGLAVEYIAPFPLTYIFRPSITQQYSEVFLFLMQIRRAKSMLERILVRGVDKKDRKVSDDLKTFYVMRSRLSWFINTLLDFLTTYVIRVQVLNFHKQLKEAGTFDDIVQSHDEHLSKIQRCCLVNTNTSSLHRAILSILDMSLQFSELFSMLVGGNTTHISRHSLKKRYRNRRQRRRRQSMIGFAEAPEELASPSSSSEEDIDEEFSNFPESQMIRESGADGESYSMLTVHVSSVEEVGERMEKFSKELDVLVRFIRRGVERLAGGTGEAAAVFGVLAFALEDWDN